MTEPARETAHYLNGKLQVLALIAQGVPFPQGRWIRVASEMVPPSLVQELVLDLFPALHARTLRTVTLLTEFDVQEFEREIANSSRDTASAGGSAPLKGASGTRGGFR